MASCVSGDGSGGGACQSVGCSRLREENEESAEVETSEKMKKLSICDAATGTKTCSKCGGAAVVFNGVCAVCFRAIIVNKFRLAVTSNAMISPTDNILVAFSGGVASRVVLQVIHEMQYKSVKNWDASRSHALPVFGVGVAFIDESAFCGTPRHVMDKAIEEIKSIVSELAPAKKELHVIAIENVFCEGDQDGKSRFDAMLETITDPTGKEDFVEYLKMLSLQKIAVDNGYSKLVLGTCTSRIARHVISATVKGQGFSLPADLQYVDSRWEVPVILPLRDCLAQELSTFCHLDNLNTPKLLDRPCSDINSLVSSFVTHLQEENPSRERTIVRTAEKLKPFSFNKFLENGYHEFIPSRIRPKFRNAKDEDSACSWVLCAICGSPLSEADSWNLNSRSEKALSGIEIFVAHCCQSCYHQILPKELNSLERFFSLLPQPMTQRVLDSLSDRRKILRNQIEDCLITSDKDDDCAAT